MPLWCTTFGANIATNSLSEECCLPFIRTTATPYCKHGHFLVVFSLPPNKCIITMHLKFSSFHYISLRSRAYLENSSSLVSTVRSPTAPGVSIKACARHWAALPEEKAQELDTANQVLDLNVHITWYTAKTMHRLAHTLKVHLNFLELCNVIYH